MKRFIALYFLFLGILFLLFTLPSSICYLSMNNFQTNLTLFTLDYFLAENQRIGQDIWIHEGYKIIISHDCNGMIPLIFFTASLWAYPSSILHKTLWMILGYIIIFIVNILRIVWVVFVTQYGRGQEDFYWSHDIVGNIVLMLSGLALFVAFIKTNPRRLKKSKDL